ncbi:hypothetical protein HC031_29775 [Planosporangium thailandense]|uniref:Copper chaperone PCu(A)C n=1 Tax=Planosporangium thailandense TaxID=765197 RepID=A0ABX0Y717_9ACTN|nr:hypothetical protein [Planosporangium thailandense]NJC73871.1 hypothetical protein [Planosporangium thailandense]
MPRSITGTPSRRRMSRVAALLAAPAAAVCLLSGCGAGQVNQTTSMVAPIAGADVNSKPHGQASLRAVEVKYNSPEGYSAGETAPLSLYIANNDAGKPLVLRSVTATDASGAPIGTVVLTGGTPSVGTGAAPSASATGEPAATEGAGGPSAGPSHRASASPSRRAAASANPSASESPSESASESPSEAPSPSPSAASVTIPASGYARLDPDSGAYLAITNLTTSLRPGSSVLVTFTFEGEDPLQVPVSFAVPLSPAPRTGAPSDAAAE